MTEQIIAQRLGIALRQVQGTVRLLRDGATIPFISRYRKEATGSLDELQVGAVKEQLDKLTELEARKQTVLSTIGEQGKLTDELRKRIEACWEAVELEDIYLPYKPKRRTRATVARERGLEPLANSIMAQHSHDIARQAQRFVTADVPTPEEAIAGACDIIAERVSEDERARNSVRRTAAREGTVHSRLVKGKEQEGYGSTSLNNDPGPVPCETYNAIALSAFFPNIGLLSAPSAGKVIIDKIIVMYFFISNNYTR